MRWNTSFSGSERSGQVVVALGMRGTGVAGAMPRGSDWSKLMSWCHGRGSGASAMLVSLLDCRLLVLDSRPVACISLGGIVAVVDNC